MVNDLVQEIIVGIIIAVTAIAIVRWLWLTLRGRRGCNCADCSSKNTCLGNFGPADKNVCQGNFGPADKNTCQGCSGKCGGCH